MRNLTLGIVVLALAVGSGVVALAAHRAGITSCSTAHAIAGGDACTSAGAATATTCEPPGGRIAGNFDPAMSGVCRYACATKLTHESRDVLAQPGAKAGRLTQCPVSGVVFLVEAGRPHVRIAGEDYATCCDRCASKLNRDPRHYLRI